MKSGTLRNKLLNRPEARVIEMDEVGVLITSISKGIDVSIELTNGCFVVTVTKGNNVLSSYSRSTSSAEVTVLVTGNSGFISVLDITSGLSSIINLNSAEIEQSTNWVIIKGTAVLTTTGLGSILLDSENILTRKVTVQADDVIDFIETSGDLIDTTVMTIL